MRKLISNNHSYAIVVFLSVILFCTTISITESFAQQSQKVPDWIKNNAAWWADGSIDSASFTDGIEFLIKEGILQVPQTTQGTSSDSEEIPDWIKNNAAWWAQGAIDEDSFISGIQFLIEEGIVQVSSASTTTQKETPTETATLTTPETTNSNKNNQPIVSQQPVTEKRYYEQETLSQKQQKLLDKANREGTVRVIVTLDTSFNPGLSKEQQATQRANINAAQNALMNSLSPGDVTFSNNFKYTPQIEMTVNPNALGQLFSSSSVKSVHEDRFHPISLTQSIPIVGADDVFAAGRDGTGQFVAILDTGVETSHSFFSGKVIEEACFTANLSGNRSLLCPDNSVSQTGTGAAAPCVDENDPPNVFPGCDHGTHVAGIAVGNNPFPNPPTAPASGVAKGAGIIAIQVFTVFKCGSPPAFDCLGAFDSDIIAGLQHVKELHDKGPDLLSSTADDATYTNKISSVNLSLGGEAFTAPCDSEPHKPAIDNLKTAGIATIIASGNDAYANAISTPACISTAVSVGSTDEFDVVPIYSNEAYFLDLLAPGGDSTTDTRITSSVLSDAFAAKSGTSMATPHVAGAWALLREAHPTATPDEILHALKLSGKNILEPFAGLIKPRIQIERALDALDHAALCNRSVTTFDAFVFGTSGNDLLGGTSGDDLIIAYGGNDSAQGLDGDDCIFGGAGADKLSGGNGNDEIHGGDGDDDLTGRDGADSLYGDGGMDIVSGGLGDDPDLDGGAGDDYVLGREGNDTMSGGDGNDVCHGESGTDTADGTCEITADVENFI